LGHKKSKLAQEDDYKEWFDENKDDLEFMAKEEAIAQYKALNITKDDIERYSRKFSRHKYTKIATHMLVLPWLWIIWSIVLGQLVFCSLPCLWYRGCCIFKRCSNYKKAGHKDGKGQIYVKYMEFL
jgi:hypothetical protein